MKQTLDFFLSCLPALVAWLLQRCADATRCHFDPEPVAGAQTETAVEKTKTRSDEDPGSGQRTLGTKKVNKSRKLTADV